MRKGFCVASFVFLFAFTGGGLSRVFALTPPSTSAAQGQEATDTQPSDLLERQTGNYELPYPGILPDHPLYIFKQVRDLILEILIVDPYKKMEFEVLQADKKLGMALALNGKRNTVAARSILEDGEGSLEQAVGTAVRFKGEGKEVPAFIVEKLVNATVKHEQVMEDVIAQSAESQSLFGESLDMVRKLQQDIATIR